MSGTVWSARHTPEPITPSYRSNAPDPPAAHPRPFPDHPGPSPTTPGQRTPRGRNWMLIRGPTGLALLGIACSQVR